MEEDEEDEDEGGGGREEWVVIRRDCRSMPIMFDPIERVGVVRTCMQPLTDHVEHIGVEVLPQCTDPLRAHLAPYPWRVEEGTGL